MENDPGFIFMCSRDYPCWVNPRMTQTCSGNLQLYYNIENLNPCRDEIFGYKNAPTPTHWPTWETWCYHFKRVISQHKLRIEVMSTSCKIALVWMSENTSDDKLTLVQVMACCRQAASHYLNQCYVNPNPCRHRASLCHIELKHPYGSQSGNAARFYEISRVVPSADQQINEKVFKILSFVYLLRSQHHQILGHLQLHSVYRQGNGTSRVNFLCM